MGTAVYRVTGITLSIVIALLGAAVALLLYYAGQDGLDLFYKDSTYMDERRRIHKRMPTDDWYGILILRGWTFGFIYVAPGLTGFTASLFFKKCPMVSHFVIGVLALFVGCFLHTAGVYALVLYRVFVAKGAILNYDTWPWDCKYIRDDDDFEQEYVDERCTTGRRASIFVIAAAGVALIAWLFLLSNLLYCGFTYHNIGKDAKMSKTSHSPDPDRPARRRYPRRRPPPSASTSDAPATNVTNTASDDVINSSPTETTPTFSTFRESASSSQQEESPQTDALVGQNAETSGNNVGQNTETSGTNETVAVDIPTAPEMVNVQEKAEITPL